MAKAIPEEIRDAIMQAFKNDTSIPDITAEFNVSHVTVRKILEGAGFDLPDKKPRRNDEYYQRPDVIERIVNLFKSGMVISEIARRETMATKTIRQILKDANAYEPRQRVQVGKRDVSDEEFIRVWQTSTSARQVEEKLDMTRQAVNQRFYNFRKHGVPLKKHQRGSTKDWNKLAEFARQFLNGDE